MAKPSYPRARRRAETIRRLVGEWMEAAQADQPGALVTVTDVRVTDDLHHASVFFTVLGDDQARAETEAWVASARRPGQDLRGLAAAAASRADARIRSRHRARPGARIDRLLAGLEGPGNPLMVPRRTNRRGRSRRGQAREHLGAGLAGGHRRDRRGGRGGDLLHIHPDGDALGSALALHLALANAGREVAGILEPFMVAPTHRFLADLDRLVPPSQSAHGSPTCSSAPTPASLTASAPWSTPSGAARTGGRRPSRSNTRFGDVNLIDAARRPAPCSAASCSAASACPRHRDRHRPLHRAGHRHRALPVPGDLPDTHLLAAERWPPGSSSTRRWPGRVRDNNIGYLRLVADALPAASPRSPRPAGSGPGSTRPTWPPTGSTWTRPRA